MSVYSPPFIIPTFRLSPVPGWNADVLNALTSSEQPPGSGPEASTLEISASIACGDLSREASASVLALGSACRTASALAGSPTGGTLPASARTATSPAFIPFNSAAPAFTAINAITAITATVMFFFIFPP